MHLTCLDATKKSDEMTPHHTRKVSEVGGELFKGDRPPLMGATALAWLGTELAGLNAARQNSKASRNGAVEVADRFEFIMHELTFATELWQMPHYMKDYNIHGVGNENYNILYVQG